MVKDLYNPFENGAYKSPGPLESLGMGASDAFFGTTYKGDIKAQNDYELQKAVNINKYAWNMEGMQQAGINPLIASGNLSNVSASQAASPASNGGVLVQELINLFDTFSPSNMIRELKGAAKQLK